ncbi:hypothetical protein SIN8267_01086 [Sinobacterium norvegicum]|uniref:Prolyl 4-hydroxylase alpha subunit Fe(2+) 2OG dioxygenase domain-containing protein n=1 Tax=Sinobacterium norvegicum TaxID=1641715 RepID=A0ABN8EH16_9GAMM|nr:2OG-Fe(II) oxygenase [Sinobacterium norvegicum]CAH0990985.1 hypothetical protein SIN8267_01086 [Sinobacterium norvegicum]
MAINAGAIPLYYSLFSHCSDEQRVVLMWLNNERVTSEVVSAWQTSLLAGCPHRVVIDGLFEPAMLDKVVKVLQQPDGWQTQQHTYDALYVDSAEWQRATTEQRFVQRDSWRPSPDDTGNNVAQQFLSFLRGEEFMALLSRIFKVVITDINVADPNINTNFFRLGAADFVGQHADDSPGREVCMLLYLNKAWQGDSGGELVFIGQDDQPVSIEPHYNRCVLFDPSSAGSEHWVERLNAEYADQYRYNVTSWYWSE